jgi:ubiquinone/menaquinone biosynthesis C-methylase UbiE
MREIVKHYDEIWRSVDFPPYLRSLYRALEQLPLDNGCRVLDVACGNGSFGEWFKSRLGAEMYGIDYSPVAVDLCKQKGYAEVKLVDLDKDPIPFEDNYFDLVILSAVVEHIMSPEEVLEQACRRLKPGGKVIVLTPNITWIINRLLFLIGRWDHSLMGGTKGHISYMNKLQLTRALTEAGFQDLDWTHSVMVVEGDSASSRNVFARTLIRVFNDRRTRIWQSLLAFNFIVIASKPEGFTDDQADTA